LYKYWGLCKFGCLCWSVHIGFSSWGVQVGVFKFVRSSWGVQVGAFCEFLVSIVRWNKPPHHVKVNPLGEELQLQYQLQAPIQQQNRTQTPTSGLTLVPHASTNFNSKILLLPQQNQLQPLLKKQQLLQPQRLMAPLRMGGCLVRSHLPQE
jgi:hypothetical protein